MKCYTDGKLQADLNESHLALTGEGSLAPQYKIFHSTENIRFDYILQHMRMGFGKIALYCIMKSFHVHYVVCVVS